uniref:Uncharacterized protein n=1 Tax=Picea sitchensis TaxID=3332 RepID=A9NYP1_PICSI|nr:unknown [Picea sitchensis]
MSSAVCQYKLQKRKSFTVSKQDKLCGAYYGIIIDDCQHRLGLRGRGNEEAEDESSGNCARILSVEAWTVIGAAAACRRYPD